MVFVREVWFVEVDVRYMAYYCVASGDFANVSGEGSSEDLICR